MNFKIENYNISNENSVFFIADIGANHNGNLNKAIDLINLASEAGANAIKFQHFKAESIVSDHGFKTLPKEDKSSHQSKWKKSVFEIYKDASIDLNWTQKLKEECNKLGVVFFTSPYSLELVDYIDKYVDAYKIGSGDINWLEIIEKIARKNKPTFMASGASTLEDVKLAINTFLKYNQNLCIMQCNTNYTGSESNFKYINLNVIKSFKKYFPDLIIGLSDHTPGHTTVLGAVTLGARVIEKHFTNDNNEEGPDHFFAMNPKTWKEMVDETKNLEFSLGSNKKIIEENEINTVILQRRAIRLNNNINKGCEIKREFLTLLRPCPKDAITPDKIDLVIGKKINKDMNAQDYIKWTDIE